MNDPIQEAIEAGIPIIDNTKDAAYYREQRAKLDDEKLAKHIFVENIDQGRPEIVPETNQIRRRISFDFVYFQHESSPFEWTEDQEAALKKRLSEQLLNAVSVQCHS